MPAAFLARRNFLMVKRGDAAAFEQASNAQSLRTAVSDIVRRQAALGIDVIDDGEYGKPIFVPRVRGFERIGAGADRQDEIDDVLELHVVNPRTHIDAVTGMKTDFLLR